MRWSTRSGSRVSIAYLTHNLIEAVDLGALAHMRVDGAWDDDLMTQVMPPSPMAGGRAKAGAGRRAQTARSALGESSWNMF